MVSPRIVFCLLRYSHLLLDSEPPQLQPPRASTVSWWVVQGAKQPLALRQQMNKDTGQLEAVDSHVCGQISKSWKEVKNLDSHTHTPVKHIHGSKRFTALFRETDLI